MKHPNRVSLQAYTTDARNIHCIANRLLLPTHRLSPTFLALELQVFCPIPFCFTARGCRCYTKTLSCVFELFFDVRPFVPHCCQSYEYILQTVYKASLPVTSQVAVLELAYADAVYVPPTWAVVVAWVLWSVVSVDLTLSVCLWTERRQTVWGVNTKPTKVGQQA